MAANCGFSSTAGNCRAATTWPSLALLCRYLGAYPDSQIDMVYFLPPLERVDRRSIAALSSQMICGEELPEMARHRTSANPWRPGVDDVPTHLTLVDDWLSRELAR